MYFYLSSKYTKLTLLRKKIGLSIPNAVTKVEEVPFPVVLVFILLCGCYAQGAKINSFQKKM